MAIPETKRCPRCGETKPASAFSPITRNGKPALKSRCKACCSEDMKAWRTATPENREKYNAYFRNRKARDPQFKKRAHAYSKDWEKRNRDKALAKCRRWASEHPVAIKAKNARRQASQCSDQRPDQRPVGVTINRVQLPLRVLPEGAFDTYCHSRSHVAPLPRRLAFAR